MSSPNHFLLRIRIFFLLRLQKGTTPDVQPLVRLLILYNQIAFVLIEQGLEFVRGSSVQDWDLLRVRLGFDQDFVRVDLLGFFLVFGHRPLSQILATRSL